MRVERLRLYVVDEVAGAPLLQLLPVPHLRHGLPIRGHGATVVGTRDRPVGRYLERYVPPLAPGPIVRALRALAAVIPEVESLTVGFDILHLARSYDTGLIARFHDRAALEAYDAHPQHKQVAAMGRDISQHVASVDFEEELIS